MVKKAKEKVVAGSDTMKKEGKKGTKGGDKGIEPKAGSGAKIPKQASGNSIAGKGSNKGFDDHDASNKSLSGHASKVSTEGGTKKKKKLHTESAKYVGVEPEWHSAELRSEELVSEGFSCCIVMIIEESHLLTEFTNYLHQAVNTGIRKQFASIDGPAILKKVKKFMTSTHQREVGMDDETHLDRMDIWAEAIKHTLLQYKSHVMADVIIQVQQEEITGVRSKEMVKHLPPLAFTAPVGESVINVKSGDLHKDHVVTPELGGNRSKSGMDKKPPTKNAKKSVRGSHSIVNATGSSIPRPTLLRKRGEIPVPILEFVEDAPPKGPRSFFLLEGFYNPKLIEELKAIGVRVDGILLLTAGLLTKRNFSVLDLEENIPGLLHPRNMLPEYAKFMKHSMKEDHDLVNQFWSEFADMLNSAAATSELHDVALMNCPIPSLDPFPTSMEQKGLFAASLFDEASKRIYEMLVLNEWFQEYKLATNIKELRPIVPDSQPKAVYDRLISQVPAECVTVGVIVECLIEQVVATVETRPKSRVHTVKAATPEPGSEVAWGMAGYRIPGTSRKYDGRMSASSESSEDTLPQFSLPTPLYIKCCDFASMRSCHLNENFAAHVASSQVCGDLHNIQSLLWDTMPEFNKGLYMKLLSNLNHFMNFLPPGVVKFQDMFFILHLLMAAGVELHLQRQTERLAIEEEQERNRAAIKARQYEYPLTSESAESLTSPFTPEGYYDYSDVPQSDGRGHGQSHVLPGTALKTDHNYLAITDNSKARFTLTPNSQTDFVHVTQFGLLAESERKELRKLSAEDKERRHQEKLHLEMMNRERLRYSEIHETEYPGEYEEEDDLWMNHSGSGGHLQKLRKSMGALILTHSMEGVPIDPVDKVHAAVVATARTIDTAGDYSEFEGEMEEYVKSRDIYQTEEESGNRTPPNTPTAKTRVSFDQSADEANRSAVTKGMSGLPWGNADEDAKRFIACEEEWFNAVSDYSVLSALLECPALLAISESGAMDLSAWVERYLFCSGLSRAAGEGDVIGDLKNWNFVEEYVPVQMIQVLNAAANSYLCMERMYCPFYDTLLFIFNNPVPKSLKGQSQFYCKLRTLPGLQHFLEYTINDDEVLEWLLDFEKNKGVEVVDSFSVSTLMRLVPEDQWMLIPSIKWALLREQKEREKMERLLASEEEDDEDHEHKHSEGLEDDEFGQLKKEKLKKSDPSITVVKNISGQKHHKGKEKSLEKVESETPPSPSQNKERKRKPSNSNSAGKKHRKRKTSVKSEDGTASKNSLTPLPDTDTDGSRPFQSALTTQGGDLGVNSNESFNFSDAVKHERGLHPEAPKPTTVYKTRGQRFNCYDLGKRVVVAEATAYHLFPLDGTIISYEVCTIDPEFRCMQLSVKKNAHQTFFYPYYIPHDLDLSAESYVVCPYFHMVHANGTIYAFRDLRSDSAPYVRLAMKQNYPQPGGVFSVEGIRLVADDTTVTFNNSDEPHFSNEEASATEIARGSLAVPSRSPVEEREERLQSLRPGFEDEDEYEGEQMSTAPPPSSPETKEPKGKKKGKAGKKEKGGKEKEKEDEKADKKKSKGKKGKEKEKAEKRKSIRELGDEEEKEKENLHSHSKSEGMVTHSKEEIHSPSTMDLGVHSDMEEEEIAGEWKYPSSENTEAEEEEGEYFEHVDVEHEHVPEQRPSIDAEKEKQNAKDSFENFRQRNKQFQFSWEFAEKLIEPLHHSFRITLPSGLFIQVDDIKGPPLSREVKQSYLAKGSASSLVEATRYYTSNGSVVKFMLNKTIQILTARGVTTNIRELSIKADGEENEITGAFELAPKVKIFNGDVILPTGKFWYIVNGKTIKHPPFYVFTSGVMPNGEVFRRRQDGVTYLHRHDGTVITHYPDGTRFTTRMIIQKDKVEEFEDWVFVGLKFMIEHPNYATVLFNTISGNVHLRTSPGEWVRVFADGSVKIGTKDEYKMDVDKHRAVLSSPPCIVNGEKDTSPNLTAVKLYHDHEFFLPPPTPQRPKSAFETMYASYAKLHEQEVAGEGGGAKPVPSTRTSTTSTAAPPTVSVSHRSLSPDTKAKKHKGPKPKKSHRHSVYAFKQKSREPTIENDLRKPVSEKLAEHVNEIAQDRKRSNKSISLAEAEVAHELEGHEEEAGRRPTLTRKKFDIEAFLTFSDMWTVCRAIDSWDNRFAVDIFGDTVVDKSSKMEAQPSLSGEDIVRTLSANFQLPKKFLSGILNSTSSEDFSTRAKRFDDLTKPAVKPCSTKILPKAKIFIVRRDLSGYEYLKKTDVDNIVTDAKNSKDATCIIDPLPGQGSKRNPRTLLTIMEPIENKGDVPHGIWKNEYREPVFRPRYLANKHLQPAKPEDLRWFGYVVVSAHARRPRFFLSPRDQYLKTRVSNGFVGKKALSIFVPQKPTNVVVEPEVLETVHEEEEEEEHSPQDSAMKLKEGEEGKKKKKEVQVKGKKEKGKKEEKHEEADKKDKKGKKKPAKSESSEKKKTIDVEKSRASLERTGSAPKTERRPSKAQSRKGSKGRAASKTEEISITTANPSITEPPKGEGEEIVTRPSPVNLNNTEIGEYPSSMHDISGLYGVELPVENAIRAQFHPDPALPKRAIIVRSIVEIPRVDEKMQRALLAASMSYSKTIDNHKKIYESYEMHDPRTEDEKLRQKGVKQHLIEQNIEQMHLFEQKEGNLLQFNL